MDYDTWKLTDWEYERHCAIEEAEEKAINDRADSLFDDYHTGDKLAVGDVMDFLEATDRWPELFDAMRKAYYVKGESFAEKRERVFKAYEGFMADICVMVAKSEGSGKYE